MEGKKGGRGKGKSGEEEEDFRAFS